MKILAFAASNSRESINKQLVTYAASVLRDESELELDIDILDLNDFEMPIFSIDRENENGIPPAAHTFYNKIGAADALLISYAEHNGSYSAAFKNIFDWASRIQARVFQDKPMVVMSTSPGGRGGASVLKQATEAAPRFGADVRASFSVASFDTAFDRESGCLTDSDLVETLRKSVLTLV